MPSAAAAAATSRMVPLLERERGEKGRGRREAGGGGMVFRGF